jgi:hypothetical protein
VNQATQNGIVSNKPHLLRTPAVTGADFLTIEKEAGGLDGLLTGATQP